MSNTDKRVWLVTGCSSGFGRAIAAHLLETGQTVVVTARKTEALEDLRGLGNAYILALDVTDPRQADSVVKKAEELAGSVDVLVNNAGIGYFASIEESDERQIQKLFDVNFFGASNMIRAVLPGMRKRRSGHIVNLTSIGGLEGFPAVGFYCATKYALEGLSDVLRKEVAPLGIRVTTVEPSGFRTEWAGSSNEAETTAPDYDATVGEAIRAYHASVGKQAGDPVRAAAAIARAVFAPEPPDRLLLGNEAFEVAIEKLGTMKREFAAWEATTRGADFPQG
ncbi:short-chain dehydrogenase/reductase SDR [Sinorhizobium meliloti CCNWSX0020]|uniref:Short-chain dehydrogenase/reductase SDR n=1 Tax=Sinorhizobium meliloti CCNWSX0020 TaxID=1107881 RepID=H0G2C8_RHIML|nr:oxidoreductase [Sinorhizobium meliloti]EHK76485.1 short-chain dehydrogenase/reductase SDR [Sinorhizobium meliloti CCNWSX0020]